jgi:hypothetical protein
MKSSTSRRDMYRLKATPLQSVANATRRLWLARDRRLQRLIAVEAGMEPERLYWNAVAGFLQGVLKAVQVLGDAVDERALDLEYESFEHFVFPRLRRQQLSKEGTGAVDSVHREPNCLPSRRKFDYDRLMNSQASWDLEWPTF